MNSLAPVFGIGIGVLILVIILMREKMKTDQMIQRGYAMKRDLGFYKDCYTFTSGISDFSAISSAIDRSILNERKISFEPNIASGWIVFHNTMTLGTFEAALQAAGLRGEKSAYRFQLLSWSGPSGGINRHDMLNANILLTTIEKAFLRLDANTSVERERTQIKTK